MAPISSWAVSWKKARARLKQTRINCFFGSHSSFIQEFCQRNVPPFLTFNALCRKCFRWLSCVPLYTCFLPFLCLGPGGGLRYCMEVLGPGIYRKLLFRAATLGRWVRRLQGPFPLLLPFPLPSQSVLPLLLTPDPMATRNGLGTTLLFPLVEPDLFFLWELELHFFNGFS